MDEAQKLDQLLIQLDIPDAVRTGLRNRAISTPAELYWTWEQEPDREASIVEILQDAGVQAGGAGNLSRSVPAGKLRRLHNECKSLSLNPIAPVGQARQVNDLQQLLPVELALRLTPEDINQRWRVFDDAYPAEVLDRTSRPSRQLIQLVHQQQRQNDFGIIAWRKILSEEQYEKSKASVTTKERSFLGILSDANGLVDTVEVNPQGSFYFVSKLLMLRGTAWALVDWCHLGSAKLYCQKFMKLYSRSFGENSGLRAPSMEEAELADAEAIREIAHQMRQGLTLDLAIHEVITLRDVLGQLLQARPRPAKIARFHDSQGKSDRTHRYEKGKGKYQQFRQQPSHQKGGKNRFQSSQQKGGKGRDNALDNIPAGLCRAFQSGSCNKGTACRYKHNCAKCNGEHARIDCRVSREGQNRQVTRT
jgi:hypothetical protein